MAALMAVAISGAVVAVIAHRQVNRTAAAKLDAASQNVRLTSLSATELVKQLFTYPKAYTALKVRPNTNTTLNPTNDLPAFFFNDYLGANARNPGSFSRIVAASTGAGAFGSYLVSPSGSTQLIMNAPSATALGSVNKATFFASSNQTYGLSGPTGVQTTVEDLGSEAYDASDPNPNVLKTRRFKVTSHEAAATGASNVSKDTSFFVDLGLPVPPEPDCDIAFAPAVNPAVGVQRSANVSATMRTYGVVSAAQIQVLKGNAGDPEIDNVTLNGANKLVTSTQTGGALSTTRTIVADPVIGNYMNPFSNMTLAGYVKGVSDYDVATGTPLGLHTCKNAAGNPATYTIPVQNPPAVQVSVTQPVPNCIDIAVRGGGYNVTKVAIFVPGFFANTEFSGTSKVQRVCGVVWDTVVAFARAYTPANGGAYSPWLQQSVAVQCRFRNPAYYINFRGVNPWNPNLVQCGGACLNTPSGGRLQVSGSGWVGCPANSHCGMVRPNFRATRGVQMHNGATSFYIANYYGGNSCSNPVAVWTRTAGCFTPDTKIRLADGREKRVDQIGEGERIYNPITGGSRAVTKIVAGPEKRAEYTVETTSGRVIVTEDHPFLTTTGLKRADQLRAGDRLVKPGTEDANGVAGIAVTLVGKRSIGTSQQDVWNFELEGEMLSPEDFIVEANGVPTGELKLQNHLKQAFVDAAAVQP